MWTNRFFSSTVHIQSDREHQVVQEGPYRFVRHPGYVHGILMGLSVPLVLGSLWALIPAFVGSVIRVIRTYLEDTTLRKELPGYVEYSNKVKHRLIPGIW
jgi:protein-S-isoprenylcysteine O-methyltransferase Ste14